MNFRYTRHIRKRIRQRHLLKEQIEAVLTNPGRSKPSFGGRYLAQKEFHGNILEVTYKKETDRVVLITAYWLEERN